MSKSKWCHEIRLLSFRLRTITVSWTATPVSMCETGSARKPTVREYMLRGLGVLYAGVRLRRNGAEQEKQPLTVTVVKWQ